MFRVGIGYDSHRFGPGDSVTLGGVAIPCDQSLLGHSDADAVLHAVTDAILGAIAAGDIGEQFPDTDPQWKDADSAIFLRHAANMATQAGYQVENLDINVLAEKPKLMGYKHKMAETMGDILSISPARINIKGKTNERMGSLGRGEGIAVQAIALLREM